LYWNSQFKELKRKDAIIKRLSYLIEEKNKYFSLAKKNRNNKLLELIDIAHSEYNERLKELNN
jgi:hypothetical protein